MMSIRNMGLRAKIMWGIGIPLVLLVGFGVISIISVNSLIRTSEWVDHTHVAIQESSARVTADPLPTVLGQQTDLTLLVQNLVNNAIRYCEPERTPEIHVAADRQENYWLLRVRDNGIGIEEKYLDRIFELGERLHSRSKYPGTGFGLAICSKIVRTHGGRIWADSEVGKGSTFCFTVKAVDS